MSIALNLHDQVALITGATGYLGRVIARTLAAAGADVAIHHHGDQEGAQSLASDITALGRRVRCFRADIGDETSVQEMGAAVARELGDPTIIVCNAVAKYPWTSILDQSVADFESQWRTSGIQAVLLAKTFIPRMISRRRGRFIAISTECAHHCAPTQGAYVAGKRADVPPMRSLPLPVLLLLLVLFSAAIPAAEANHPVGFSTVGEVSVGVPGADPEVGTRLTKAGSQAIYRPAVTAPARIAISVYRVIEANRLTEEGAAPKQRYEIHHQGRVDTVDLDFSGTSGWAPLGTFPFAGQGMEFVAVQGRTAEIRFTIMGEGGDIPVCSTVIAPPPNAPKPRPAPAGGILPAEDSDVGTPPPPAPAPAPATGLQLPPHIADHMIIQRDRPIMITGQAPEGASITATLAGAAVTCTATKGAFRAVLPAMPAGGPYELTITGAGDTRTIRDVAVGDIWIVAGQSNMAFVAGGLDNAKAVLAEAELPGLRLYVQRGSSAGAGRRPARWEPCTAKAASGFSAVGFLLGRGLHRALHVPIGIMYVVRDGGDIRLFMRDAALAALAPGVPFHYGSKPRPTLFSDFLESLIGYPVTGMVYYQGEGNQKEPLHYRKLLPAMIQDVRALWGQEDLPVVVIQLPRYKDGFVGIREAQFLATGEVPRTALVTTIDTGSPRALHPADKGPIGERAVQAALGLAYHQPGEHVGPRFDRADVVGGRMQLHFGHVGAGLVARGDLDGFLLAGDDGALAPAHAAIIAPDTVAVWRDDVPHPATVRYLWSGDPRPCLANAEGFPASPFRTDSRAIDRIYDQRDPCLSCRGAWATHTGPGVFGPDALSALDLRTQEGDSDWPAYGKWALEVAETGSYELALRWPSGLPATAAITVEVTASGYAFPARTFSQASGGGAWTSLGTYPLRVGNGDQVKVVAGGAGACVDALRMQRYP